MLAFVATFFKFVLIIRVICFSDQFCKAPKALKIEFVDQKLSQKENRPVNSREVFFVEILLYFQLEMYSGFPKISPRWWQGRVFEILNYLH